MDTATVAALVAVGMFALNLFMSYRGGAWRLEDRLGKMERRLTDALAAQTREHESKMDTVERNFGETARAMQTKIHEIEKWARDEFVRKNSFENAMARIEKSLDRLNEKLDGLQARH